MTPSTATLVRASEPSSPPIEQGPADRDALCALFERLGYRVNPIAVPPEHQAAWALEGEEVTRLTWIGSLTERRGFQILLAERANVAAEEHVAWMTRWAGRLWRANRTFQGVLVCAGAERWGECLVSVVYPDGQVSRPGLRHVRLQAEALRADTVERLKRLAVLRVDTSPGRLTRRLTDELDLIHVTRAFYERFKQARDRVAEGWVGAEGATPEERRELALLTLSRLLFVYFLQRKGLLDGREDFVRRAAQRVALDPERRLYRDLLKPLFFGLLNTPEPRREAAARRLGEVPYLNGGLFEPIALEREHPSLDLPDGIVREVLHELLERYTFTIREDGDGVGVDPEMLGRVFEGLMGEGERGASGTFFTPRELVDTLVDQTLAEWLGREGLRDVQVEALLGEGESLVMSPMEARRLLVRLDDLAILDPACGSGAFLVGMLGRLEGLRRRLGWIAGEPVDAKLRRRIVCRNLYGVDVSPAAVRLCELRLWLAILDEAPAGVAIEPLPNLDHRVRQGDALLEPGDWTTAPADLEVVREAAREIEAIKGCYAAASASEKVYARAALQEAERELFSELVDCQLRRVTARIEQIEAAQEAPDLWGERRSAPKGLREELKALKRRAKELRVSARGIEREERSPGFLPPIHFPEVVARGGFDVVIGNPPWVRLHAIPAAQRERLKRRYRVMQAPSWTAGGMLRHLKGFGGQVDLSVCFVERSLELLRDGGVMGLWLPSKFMRALYGGGVRRLLMTRARPVRLTELGEGLFAGAKTYPCALVAVRGRPLPGPHQRVRVAVSAEDEGREVPLERLRWDARDPGSPWVVAAGHGRARLRGRRVGHHPGLRVCRGVMTGLNEAFIVADDRARGVSQERLMPLLRGGQVSAWRWQARDRIIWTHDEAEGAPLSELPPSLHQALSPYRARLERRSDFRGGPWWRIFRAGAHVLSPKVVWSDLGTQLEAVAIPGRAVVDGQERPIIPLNTVYYIPTATYEQALVLAAWLNATPARELVSGLAERAASGYRRFFSWVIALLPLPDALDRALRPEVDAWAEAARVPAVAELLEVSRALHEEPELTGGQGEIDRLVGRLYGGGR